MTAVIMQAARREGRGSDGCHLISRVSPEPCEAG